MMTEMNDEPQKKARFLKNLNNIWQLTGAFIAPVLFTFLFIQYGTNPGLNMYQWLLWLHLPIIMIHEFEEYIFPGGFKNFFNTSTIFSPHELQDETPVSEAYIFFVNPVLIWPWAIIGAVFYTLPWIGFSLIIFQFVINNVQHAVLFQLKRKGYNPGLFTTLFVLIPYCTLVTWYVIANNTLTTPDWIFSFLVCAGVVVTLMAITLTRIKHANHG
jgi:Protein of unknown function with HXXEE motif